MENLIQLFLSLLAGLRVTIVVTLGAFAMIVPMALLGGLGRRSRHRFWRYLAASYIELFRGTSALVQLYWFYFALPLIGLSLPATLTGIVVLGLNGGAYGAEIVRGALGAVSPAQVEGAVALNFSPNQIRWKIIFPQALTLMLPPLGNLSIEVLKSSALVSLITLADLTFRAQLLRTETHQTKTIFALSLGIYFLLAMGLRWTFQRMEKKFAFSRA